MRFSRACPQTQGKEDGEEGGGMAFGCSMHMFQCLLSVCCERKRFSLLSGLHQALGVHPSLSAPFFWCLQIAGKQHQLPALSHYLCLLKHFAFLPGLCGALAVTEMWQSSGNWEPSGQLSVGMGWGCPGWLWNCQRADGKTGFASDMKRRSLGQHVCCCSGRCLCSLSIQSP